MSSSSPVSLSHGKAEELFDLTRDSKNRSSVDHVYDQILQRIVRGELISGEVLICTRLAKELGVSRTPVVSAVDRLAGDGILIKEKNRRARVRDSADSWLVQIHQLREMVEPPAAGLAAQHITAQAVRDLQRLAQIAEPDGQEDWQLAARNFDFALHLTIADQCQNLPLRETIYNCWKFKRVSYQLGCANPELEEIGYREHLTILSALSRHDPDTASVAMLYHLRSSFTYTKYREVV